MAKEGKKPIGKIVLGVIVVLVIVGTVGSMGGNSTDSSASDSAKPAEATQQAEEQKEPQEPYAIADEAEDTSNQFAFKITGTLTNNTDKDDMRKPLGSPPPRCSFFPRARGATMGFEYRPVR